MRYFKYNFLFFLCLTKVWFQNRRAKWRKKEQTRKGPGRPAHNAHPQSCSGEPIPPDELERRERLRHEKKILKQLERQQKKLALKGIHVTLEQLREEQKTRRKDQDSFSEEVSESNSSKCPMEAVEGRDTSIRRTTFSIESILGTSGTCEKGPPSPGTLMRGAPTPPLTPRNFSTAAPSSPTSSAIPPEPSEEHSFINETTNEIKDALLKIPSLGARVGHQNPKTSLEGSPSHQKQENTHDINIPNFSFKNWQSFMPQFLGYNNSGKISIPQNGASPSGNESTDFRRCETSKSPPGVTIPESTISTTTTSSLSFLNPDYQLKRNLKTNPTSTASREETNPPNFILDTGEDLPQESLKCTKEIKVENEENKISAFVDIF